MTTSANTSAVVLDSSGLPDAIVDVAGCALIVIDTTGKIVRWNQAAAVITGFSAAEMIGEDFAKTALFAEDFDKWQGEFSRIMDGSLARIPEFRWKLRDGSVRVFACSPAMIRNAAGAIAYVVCTIRDQAPGTLSAELMRERMVERRDISGFLHRTISQNLVALSFSVSKLQADVHEGAAANANRALDLIDRCCRDVRVISYMLAPPFPSESSLEALIESYVDYLRDEVGLTIRLEAVSVPHPMSPEVQSLFFAAVQEWTARAIRKNPRASLAIRLAVDDRGETALELESTPGAPEMVDGWTVFRERIRALGGHFDLSEGPLRALARLSLSESGPPR